MNENLEPAIELIKKFEGCRLEAYPDPISGTPYTIGYGHTKGVKPGDVITQAQAEQMLQEDVQSFCGEIKALITVSYTSSHLCALISFAYNCGIEALKSSTLLKKLNAGDPIGDIAAEFLKWDHAGGKVIPGLLERRKAEAALFIKQGIVSAPVLYSGPLGPKGHIKITVAGTNVHVEIDQDFTYFTDLLAKIALHGPGVPGPLPNV